MGEMGESAKRKDLYDLATYLPTFIIKNNLKVFSLVTGRMPLQFI